MYRTFLNALRMVNPLLKVIGFTATPWRLGHGHIAEEGHIFTDVCFDITGMEAFNRLIAEGYLSPLIPKRTQTVLNVDGVHMRGGEFIPSELQNAVDKDELTERALKESLESGYGRQCALVFASGVDHAINIHHMLTDMGEKSVVVHSKMSASERDKNIAALRNGVVRWAVNNNILTTGIDIPQIDLITMLRPTASTVLWVQMLGRGTRPVYAPGFDLTVLEERWAAIRAGGKENCLVLDYAGNTKRLGPINDPVIPGPKGKGTGDAPVRICERCNTYNHASARVCICCGFEFPIAVKLKQAASSEELIKDSLPQVEVFRVDQITVAMHEKQGRPPSLRVSYFCGLRKFDEFVCPQHPGPAGKLAILWWAERSNGASIPRTTLECMAAIDKLHMATDLRVWINKKYPEILAQCLDDTGFGTREARDSYEGPKIELLRPTTARTSKLQRDSALGQLAQEVQPPSLDSAAFDDDIPF